MNLGWGLNSLSLSLSLSRKAACKLSIIASLFLLSSAANAELTEFKYDSTAFGFKTGYVFTDQSSLSRTIVANPNYVGKFLFSGVKILDRDGNIVRDDKISGRNTTINGATISSFANSALLRSDTGDLRGVAPHKLENNTLIIQSDQATKNGSSINGNLYGAYAKLSVGESDQRSINELYNNKVIIKDKTNINISNGSIYGAYGEEFSKVGAEGKGNSVSISDSALSFSNSIVNNSVYGGYSQFGSANHNKVDINNLSGINNKITHIYGGQAYDAYKGFYLKDKNGNNISEASHNIVNAGSGLSIVSRIYGGYSRYNAMNNKVTISSNLDVPLTLMGGYSKQKEASNNIVEIKDKAKAVQIYGGHVDSRPSGGLSIAKNNSVLITSSGNGNRFIYGGHADIVENNKVDISDVATGSGMYYSFQEVYGGYSAYSVSEKGQYANSNTVFITDSKFLNTVQTHTVAGGYSRHGDANKNTVTISGLDSAKEVYIYGGDSRADTLTPLKAANENNVNISNLNRLKTT